MSLWITFGILLVALLVLRNKLTSEPGASIDMPPIASQTIDQLQPLQFVVEADAVGMPRASLSFQLVEGPPGAMLDPQCGRFEWCPGREQSPGSYRVSVRVVGSGESAQRSFQIQVRKLRLGPELVSADRPTPSGRGDGESPIPDSGDQPPTDAPDGPSPPAEMPGKEIAAGAPLVPSDESPKVPSALEAAARKWQEAATRDGPDGGQGEAGKPPIDPGDQLFLDLYTKHRLLSKHEYEKIRDVYARRFEADQAGVIEQVFGDSTSDMRRWLDSRPDIKQEFYLAIDSKYDDVPRVLSLFKELRTRFPDKFEAYANLAIAVSVVWDQEQGSIHGSPAGADSLPEGQMGPFENFEYYMTAEPYMGGRIRYLPWEFLVHVVNHRTTLPERKWALLTYLPKRTMIGTCYGDVPYDWGSLKGEPPKMTGKLFTLPNQAMYGGVCVCQADFAARVTKSLGIPAFSAGGPTKGGEGHAFVMWVELGPVTQAGFRFSLESACRMGIYVGGLGDPHTSQPVTDRELEVRLHAVGLDPIAKRQSDLVMRAYPMLRDSTGMELHDQLKFLHLVLQLCPGNTDAWKTLAQMSRDGQITKVNSEPMYRVLGLLFETFKNMPDFTWTLFDDLTYFEDRVQRRGELYAKLAAMYEAVQRVDLSCEARIRYSELLLAEGRKRDAIDVLAQACLLFPDDGVYTPKMIDRLESICKGDPKATEPLAQFYQKLLPMIPQMQGERPNYYCIAMYKRGIQVFDDAGLSPLATTYTVKLKILEETDPAKKKLGRPLRVVIQEALQGRQKGREGQGDQ